MLSPEEKLVNFNVREYISYLAKLRNYRENELIIKTLIVNKGVFDLNEKFEEWLKNDIAQIIKSFSSKSLIKKDLIRSYTNILYKVIDLENDFYEEMTIKQYIQRLKPSYEIDDHSNKNIEERKTITIYEYMEHRLLSAGDYFGGSHFSSNTRKRNFTAISTDDCKLTYMTLYDYEKFVKDILEKNELAEYDFLLSSSIFNGVDKQALLKKYYIYFQNGKIKQSKTFIVENSPAEYVYFIKSGEFHLSIKRNLNDLDELIRYYGNSDKVYQIHKYVASKSYNEKSYKMLQEKQILHVISIY